MSAWKSTTLTLGHSPDPDDAFMFYAMAKNKIDLKGYRFTHILEDIQTLNERATRGELHITALSIHALAYVLDRYALLPSGASMGNGYGPVFVTKDSHGLSEGADDAKQKGLASRQNDRRARPHDQRVSGGAALSWTGFRLHRRSLRRNLRSGALGRGRRRA